MSRHILAVVAVVAAALALAGPASAAPFVYYGSNNGDGVFRAEIDGSDPTRIIGGGEFAASLAVDRRHIYFKSLSTAISRADIDGASLDSDFITLPSNAVTIKEIEVNATHVFWTDDFNNAIGRARIAGPCVVGTAPPCDVEPTWIPAGSTGTGDGGVSGLAVDDAHVYWTRVVAGTIARANLDGSSRDKDFITGINTLGLDQAPFDVDVNRTHIYWTDAPDEVIGRAELNGSGPPVNLERTYLDTDLNSITAVEANDTHVHWASDGGTVGRARIAGTCTTGTPPCDVNLSFIGGGSQVRSLALGFVPVDVVVTDCGDPDLADLTEVTGDLIVQNVAGCDDISFPNLNEVVGSIIIDGNANAETIDLGSLTSAIGGITITDNTAAETIDIGALTSATGGITITDNTAAETIDIGALAETTGTVSITDNTSATVIDAGSLTTVTGSIEIDENAAGTIVDAAALTDVSGSVGLESAGEVVDLTGAEVDGDLTLTANGSDSVAATTPGGTADVEVLGGTAAMHVVLPDGTFEEPVDFTIEREGNGPPETGTTPAGAPAAIDPVAGYRFAFDVTTLEQDAQLAFTVDLAQLDAATRAAVMAGVADQTATLTVRADGPGEPLRALSRCTGAQTPAANRCVAVTQLGADGQPVASGATPALVRFDAVADHFSAYAVAIAKPIASPSLSPLPPPSPSPSLGPSASPPPAAAATLAPRPTATPKPSNRFRLAGLARNRRNGTATLSVVLPGPGRLALRGQGLARLRRTVTSRSRGRVTVRLRIRATGAARRALRRTGRTRVTVKVVYTPAGGIPSTRTKRITLRFNR